MKTLLLILSVLFPFLAQGQPRYPNYFSTNAAPFNVVPGVGMYVPVLYSTNITTTNLTVTDYLFIGTAQINYLQMLGNIYQQGVNYTNLFNANTNYFAGSVVASNFTGNGAEVTNVNALTNFTQNFELIAGSVDNQSYTIGPFSPNWMIVAAEVFATNTSAWASNSPTLLMRLNYSALPGSDISDAVSFTTAAVDPELTNSYQQFSGFQPLVFSSTTNDNMISDITWGATPGETEVVRGYYNVRLKRF